MDYIPGKDADALIWMRAFANVISASPSTYQLVPPDGVMLSTAVDEFETALQTANTQSTRTPGAIQTKDTKRNAAETLCRQYAVQIKYNNAISDTAKIDLGVRPVNESREPVYCPQSSPLLSITAATPGAQTLRYADSLNPTTAGKPFGAAALQLFMYVGDEATTNEDQAQFVGLFTRNPVAVTFDPADDGKVATFFARWSGGRGDTGNWSLPTSMRIAA
ncbi:MAG: hypothetical protein ACR2GY_13300 [Phycisphaerales bacterium]